MKTLQPKTLSLLLLLLCLSSCIKEDTQVEVNYRPQLRLTYRYLNNEGENTLADVQKLNIAVSNSQSEIVSQKEIIREQMGEYIPLYGVPEDTYTVVSFGNTDSSTVYRKYDLLHVALDSKKEYSTTDKLFHHVQKFTVQRGTPKLDTAYLDKLYCEVDLKIVGLRQLDDVSLTDFSAYIDGTPRGFTQSKAPIEKMRITPRLQFFTNDTTSSRFNVHKFTDAGKVSLTLKYRDEVLAHFPLSDYLNDRRSGIDLYNDRDIVIPIVLDITSASVKITINDWFAAEIQITHVGS